MAIDQDKIRKDFPALNQQVYNKQYVYFDNAATTHKPEVVIQRIKDFYSFENSSIHRAVNFLSGKATQQYENSRERVKTFINAGKNREIIFTSGATASINLVASSFGEEFVKEGDEILVSEMEHHSNIVPWQLLCKRKSAALKVIPFNEAGELDISEYHKLLNKKTKIVAITHVSNSLGTINPVKEMISYAHEMDVPVLIDGAQAVPHKNVDVQDLDCDFYVFSGHKIYGPTGIGVLYGKENWLEKIPPYQGGGDMIENVSFKETTFADLPFKFEAGTTNFTAAIGLATAIDYFQDIGMDNIFSHELNILNYATDRLKEIKDLRIYGNADKKIGVISFLLNNIHQYDTGMILDKLGIAVRTGTLCAQPVMDHYNIAGTVRISFGIYNTREEIDILLSGIHEIIDMLG